VRLHSQPFARCANPRFALGTGPVGTGLHERDLRPRWAGRQSRELGSAGSTTGQPRSRSAQAFLTNRGREPSGLTQSGSTINLDSSIASDQDA
jgi:hypothetical protein